MFVKPRYNKEKGVALCYSSRVVVTKNYREFRLNVRKNTQFMQKHQKKCVKTQKKAFFAQYLIKLGKIW